MTVAMSTTNPLVRLRNAVMSSPSAWPRRANISPSDKPAVSKDRAGMADGHLLRGRVGREEITREEGKRRRVVDSPVVVVVVVIVGGGGGGVVGVVGDGGGVGVGVGVGGAVSSSRQYNSDDPITTADEITRDSRVESAEEEVRQAGVLRHQVHGDTGQGKRHPVRVPAEVVALGVLHELETTTERGPNARVWDGRGGYELSQSLSLFIMSNLHAFSIFSPNCRLFE